MTEETVETRIELPISGHSGKRFAIALASWLPAGVGVLSSIMFAGVGLVGTHSNSQGVLIFLPLLAWIALAAMSVRWVQDRHCHWLWPILGTLSGVVSSISFVGVFFFYVSALPLAIYVVVWHLKHRVRGERAA